MAPLYLSPKELHPSTIMRPIGDCHLGTETELKLELSADAADTLLGSGLLGEPVSVEPLTSIYFDTPDHQVWQGGYSLRIRSVGEAHIQTVKATGPNNAIFARSEWEAPVTGNTPVIDYSTPLKAELDIDATAPIPQFSTSVKRHRWNVDQDGSKIEVALDTGLVVAGDRQTQIRELELELKDGKPNALFVLARRIEAIVPIHFGVASKAERGYRLLGEQTTAYKAEAVHLDRELRVSASFQIIAEACLRQFRLNESILLDRANPSALHQARVSLRRLRSAFSLYKAVLVDAESRRLKDELKWLTGVLGTARNIDVLIARAGSSDIRVRLLEARDSAYDDVLNALYSSRAKALMLDVNEWLRCGEYLTLSETTEIRNGPVVDFAIETLDRHRKKLKKRGKSLVEADDEHRHEARKAAKKLRYACEFLSSLFTSKQAERRYAKFIKSMEELQDELGLLNDMATAPTVVHELELDSHPDAEPLVAVGNREKLLNAAQSSLDDLMERKRFWRG
ncbi:hypothetical protein RGCCGE502_15310 [Rhizobium grahamii CCGE 502]|uniref:Ceramide glucosyltransferase n=1 Tax=Rhizobium grahamii CCGE 502 TaxID=990285 RepID=S3HH53_9HYPH|nr:hypothetical protein RGCCGE502_15310 [Rhizobium grahamii CCGE 502]